MSAGGTRLVIDPRILNGRQYMIHILMVYNVYALIHPCLVVASVYTTTTAFLQGTVLPYGVLVPTGK